jgi:hypothetical protein
VLVDAGEEELVVEAGGVEGGSGAGAGAVLAAVLVADPAALTTVLAAWDTAPVAAETAPVAPETAPVAPETPEGWPSANALVTLRELAPKARRLKASARQSLRHAPRIHCPIYPFAENQTHTLSGELSPHQVSYAASYSIAGGPVGTAIAPGARVSPAAA